VRIVWQTVTALSILILLGIGVLLVLIDLAR